MVIRHSLTHFPFRTAPAKFYLEQAGWTSALDPHGSDGSKNPTQDFEAITNRGHYNARRRAKKSFDFLPVTFEMGVEAFP